MLESKFYIDDFQLFMAEVSGSKASKLFGIVFFNNRKKASFLGKKILRELIFEFDQIEFFYALHPIKMHTSSALLGDVLVFSLFRGKKMIHDREFPEQITAADEILQYIKNLIKLGDIAFDTRKPKNLIQTQEQRSFDHKIETSPEKLSDFGVRPNRTTEILKLKPVTPEKELKIRKVFTNPKQDSPSKSHITNEISFDNDLYQPEWFSEGDALSRLEKGVLSALIKSSDSNLLNFLQGLNLKAASRHTVNLQLVKVPPSLLRSSSRTSSTNVSLSSQTPNASSSTKTRTTDKASSSRPCSSSASSETLLTLFRPSAGDSGLWGLPCEWVAKRWPPSLSDWGHPRLLRLAVLLRSR
jgi:hypothetical protein